MLLVLLCCCIFFSLFFFVILCGWSSCLVMFFLIVNVVGLRLWCGCGCCLMRWSVVFRVWCVLLSVFRCWDGMMVLNLVC